MLPRWRKQEKLVFWHIHTTHGTAVLRQGVDWVLRSLLILGSSGSGGKTTHLDVLGVSEERREDREGPVCGGDVNEST
jgi:hypothetical protein